MQKTLLYILIIFIVLSCGKNVDTDSLTVAKIDKSVLTETDVDRLQLAIANKAFSKSDIIADWVERELLFMAAQEAGIEEDETLKSQIDTYRKDLIGSTFLESNILSNITVNNSEIRLYYDKNRDMFTHQNDGAKIMHFFTRIDTVADFIYNTLNNANDSIDRKELLSEYQVDVSTIERGSLIDVLDKPIFSASNMDNIIGPVQTEYGFHIIEILGKYSSGSQIDLDQAYDEIYQILFNQKKELKSVAFLDSLRNTYNIKIYLENN